ncbi:kinase-like protein, partial [Suillus hirtellus]
MDDKWVSRKLPEKGPQTYSFTIPEAGHGKRLCLTRPAESQAKQSRQIASGLKYLHANDIVHGDLTPTNVLVDSDGRLRLADFGLSIILEESGNPTFNFSHAGNMRWMAPEIVEGQARPTVHADVYSHGCIVIQ